MDQQVNYRVNIDDSDFQAKLSMMRASIDTTMGGMNGMGGMGMGGMSGPMLGGMFNAMTGGSSYMGGYADFGTQIRPVSYTPPAIAMQPHFGMVQVQQTLGAAGIGTAGPIAMGLKYGTNRYEIPSAQISMAEYSALSARGFGARMGDAAGIGLLTAGSTAAGMVAGGVGSMLGSSILSGFPLGGMVGGLLGGAMGGMVVSGYAGEVAEMMAANRSNQTALASGSFRFISGGNDVDPITGRGFSRAARSDIAKSIQNLELQDVRFGMGEMSQVLETGMQMDMFSGSRDAEDFKGKFKNLVDTLKTVTATLHTSLKEGVEVIRGFRDMGVTDPAMINQLTLNAEAMGRASGRTGMEMLAIGQTGAEMFRGTGIRMGLGFESNQMNAVSVRNLLNQGLLSRETIGQAGGENSLAQQITANSLASFQSAMGRGAMMANFDPATGQFRPDMINRMMGQDANSMVSNAANLGARGIFALQAHQHELIGQMDPMQMRLFGLAPDLALARSVASSSGANTEDVYRSMQLRRGVSQEVIDANIAFMKQDPEEFKKSQESAIESMRTQAGLEDFRNRFGFKRVTNAIRSFAVQPLSDSLMDLAGGVEQATLDIGFTLMGGESGPRSMSRGAVNRGAALLGKDFSGRGLVVDSRGSAYQNMVGGQTGAAFANSVMAEVAGGNMSYMGEKVYEFSSQEAAASYGQRAGLDFTVVGERDGKLMMMSMSSQKKILDNARGFEVTASTREKVDAEIKKKGLDNKSLDKLYGAAAASGGELDLQGALGALGETTDSIRGKEVEIAKLERMAESMGSAGSKVLSDLKKLRDTRGVTDSVQKGATLTAKESEEYRQGALRILSSGTTGDDQAAVSKLMKETGGNAEAVASLADLAGKEKGSVDYLKARAKFENAVKDSTSEDQRKRIIDRFEHLSGTEQFNFIQKAKMVDVRQAQSQEQKALALGGDPSKIGLEGGVGGVSVQTMNQIHLMGQQLESNYKALIAMQKNLNDLIDKGRSGLNK